MNTYYQTIFYFLLETTIFCHPIANIEIAYDTSKREPRQVNCMISMLVEEELTTGESAFRQVTNIVEYKGAQGSREVSIFPNIIKGSLTNAMTMDKDGSGRHNCILAKWTG